MFNRSNRSNFNKKLIIMTINYHFKQICCPLKPLKKNIYNPEVLSKFPLNIRIAHQIVASVGTHNQCYTRVNVPLNAYGKWAGAPGGSGPGVSSTMNYMPYTNTSGLGPKVGVPNGGPLTINRN